MQRNWIGRSVGAQFSFGVVHGPLAGERIEVYTTRPDTLFGATYVVIAPEHPLALRLPSIEQLAAVEAYTAAASRKSDLERTELAKEKTGVWTGASVLNPATGTLIPVWVAGTARSSPRRPRVLIRTLPQTTFSEATAAVPSWLSQPMTSGTQSLQQLLDWRSGQW